MLPPVTKHGRRRVMDVLFVGLVLLFFGLSWGLVRLIERL
jgi:hypothetical protein